MSSRTNGWQLCSPLRSSKRQRMPVGVIEKAFPSWELSSTVAFSPTYYCNFSERPFGRILRALAHSFWERGEKSRSRSGGTQWFDIVHQHGTRTECPFGPRITPSNGLPFRAQEFPRVLVRFSNSRIRFLSCPSLCVKFFQRDTSRPVVFPAACIPGV